MSDNIKVNNINLEEEKSDMSNENDFGEELNVIYESLDEKTKKRIGCFTKNGFLKYHF